MGCNCKNKDKLEQGLTSSPKRKLSTVEKIIVFITKVFGFLVGAIIISIIVIPFALYTLFKIIFLDDSIDITGAMVGIGKLITPKEDKGADYADINTLDNIDDYELTGVDDITDEVNK